jgi:hypothetical protein
MWRVIWRLRLIETLCVRNQIDEYKIKKLLRHPDTSIAIATAEGIWHAEPEETITESLKQEWRNVIVNATKEIYWLDKAFEQDNSLAYEWMRNYLNNDKYIYFDHINKNTLLSAIKILDDNQKREILNNTSIKYGIEQFIFYLIGDDLELYSFLLKKKELSKVHLVPLSGYPGECIWLQKAKIALDSGYLIEDIVNSAFHPVEMVFTWGPMSKTWIVWIEQFELLCSNPDINITKIGQLGKETATRRLKEALKREKLEAIYGD